MNDTVQQREKEPWAIFIGATIVSLAIVIFLGGCSLPDWSVPVGGDAIDLAALGAGQLPTQPATGTSPVSPTTTEVSVDRLVEEDAALGHLNRVRASVGLPALAREALVSEGAQHHAEYLWQNGDAVAGVSPHEEEPGLPGYTGDHYWDRLEAAGVDLRDTPGLGEVIASHPRGVSAVVHWLETVYHRLPLLSPDGLAAGYGHVAADGRAANVMDLVAQTGAGPDWPALILYPADGQEAVPTSWDGLEAPRPPAPDSGFPSGPVVSVSTHLGAELVVEKHVLRPEGGAPLAHVFLSATNDPNLERAAAVALYADEPLAPGTRYLVQVAGEVDGVPFDETWHFTTAGHWTDCLPAAGDCGPGRGCYHVVGPLTCEFLGIGAEDGACVHVNDCEPEMTCFRGTCQAYCALEPGDGLPVEPCQARCRHGHVALASGDEGLGICLPPACDPHGDGCGVGRWCSWGGGFVCDREGWIPAGEPCDSTVSCRRGSSCLDFGDGFRCHTLCVSDDATGGVLKSCADACPDAARTIDTDEQVAVCP